MSEKVRPGEFGIADAAIARVRYPKRGEPVQGNCIECGRAPRPGETYGPHKEGWDFTNICPEGWDRLFAEQDEEEGPLTPFDSEDE